MSTVNIITSNNTISVVDSNQTISIAGDNKKEHTLSVSQPVTSIVQVVAAGPQGTAGITPDTSIFITTSSFNSFTSSFNNITGSFATTGSNRFIGNQIITGSIYLPDNAHSIYFSGSGAPSRLTWNDTDGTLDLGLKGGNVTLQIGQEEVVRVVNKTGTNLTEAGYQVVRIDGAQGGRVKVVLAKGDADGNSLDTLGIVTENIDVNQEGFVTVSGLVRGINTTGNLQGESWTDGDALYLSPTTLGGLTITPPTAPSHSVRMGYVVQSNPSQGSIYVKVDNGYELDELHNVYINTSSLAYGDLLMRDGNNVWVNTKTLSGSYTISGSLTGAVIPLTISSNTASLNLSLGNFYTLQLVSGSNTHINPSNIRPGETVSLLLSTTGSGTVSFPSTVKQPSGSSYIPTTSTGKDILTFISFDSSTLYVANVKNLI